MDTNFPLTASFLWIECVITSKIKEFEETLWPTIQGYLSYDFIVPVIVGAFGGGNFVYTELKTNGLN